MTENFGNNLLRFIAAETFVLVAMQVSREMFGKGYFSLSAAEKAAVDQTAVGTVNANFQGLTPDFLDPKTGRGPLGFQGQPSEPKAEFEKKYSYLS